MRDAWARRQAQVAFMLARRALTASAVLLPQASQENWYINADTGSDLNSGRAPSVPLKTWGQYLFLTGYEENIDGRSVDVFVAGSFPPSDPIAKRIRTTGYNAHFGLHGTPTTFATTLATYTPSNTATNTRCSFSVPSGLTPAMLGALVFFPKQNVYSQITTIVGQTATCLDPTSESITPTRATPLPGDPVTIIQGTPCRLLLQIIESTNLIEGYPGPILIENLAPYGLASIHKEIGNDQVLDPLIRFCQFPDMDVVADGTILVRHCSVKVAGETCVRSRFDATQGVYFQTGVAVLSDPAAQFPNCHLTGVEFGTLASGSNVNEIGGGALTNFTRFFASNDRLGFWSSGGFGAINILDIHECELGAGEYWGHCNTTNAWNLGRNCTLSYGGGTSFPLTGITNQLAFTRGSGANAWPVIAANGSQAPQAPCRSMADVLASPFNGRALDPSSNSQIIPA